jgi:hypothetical protein
MTKERQPLTPYRALTKISGLLGWDGCATVIDKKETTLRKYSDPDTGRELSMRDAIRLDAAYRRAGGLGAPLFEAYATALDMGWPADQIDGADLLAAISAVAKEAGEAVSAALDTAGSNDPTLRALGIKETGEGLEAMQTLYTLMQRGAR